MEAEADRTVSGRGGSHLLAIVGDIPVRVAVVHAPICGEPGSCEDAQALLGDTPARPAPGLADFAESSGKLGRVSVPDRNAPSVHSDVPPAGNDASDGSDG